MGIYNDLLFTEGIDQVKLLLESTDAGEISDRLEQIAVNQDLAHVCLMLLTMKAKGIDISDANGIEMANVQPSFSDLILPPGSYM